MIYEAFKIEEMEQGYCEVQEELTSEQNLMIEISENSKIDALKTGELNIIEVKKDTPLLVSM